MKICRGAYKVYTIELALGQIKMQKTKNSTTTNINNPNFPPSRHLYICLSTYKIGLFGIFSPEVVIV